MAIEPFPQHPFFDTNSGWISVPWQQWFNLLVDNVGSGGGGGAVDSVFGRTGVVVAVSGDYDHPEIGNQTANDHHNEAHTIASHSDTTATGAELETLTDGSDADSLHAHAIANAHIASTSNPHSTDIDDVTPTTTKGDVIVEDGSNAIRLAVGLDGEVLTADSGETSGLKWAKADPGLSGDIYIDVGGNDTTGDGSSGNPFLTRQEVIGRLPRRIITQTDMLLGPGTYTNDIDTTGIVTIANLGFIARDTSDNDLFTNGAATSGGATTLTDSGATWVTNLFATGRVYIHQGTGIGQIRTISSNTGTILTVSSAWTTNPDATSKYVVCGVAIIDNSGPSDWIPNNIGNFTVKGFSYLNQATYSINTQNKSKGNIDYCHFDAQRGIDVFSYTNVSTIYNYYSVPSNSQGMVVQTFASGAAFASIFAGETKTGTTGVKTQLFSDFVQTGGAFANRFQDLNIGMETLNVALGEASGSQSFSNNNTNVSPAAAAVPEWNS